jgi:Tfp pilus assembly protein PilN
LRASLRQLTSEVQDASLHLERARALRSKRAWSSLLATIGGALPERCWLTSMATDPASPAPGMRTIDAKARGGQPGTTSASANAEQKVVLIDGPRALRISGYASDASDPLAFVTHLKETGLFRTVHLESFRSEPTPGVLATRGTARGVDAIFRFDVLCEW